MAKTSVYHALFTLITNVLGQILLLLGMFMTLIYFDNKIVSLNKISIAFVVGTIMSVIYSKLQNMDVIKSLFTQSIYSFSGAIIIYAAGITYKYIYSSKLSNYDYAIVVIALIVLAMNIAYKLSRKHGPPQRDIRGRS